VDFCVTCAAKIPIIRHPWAVCRVKNRLIGGFWRFYARSATNCQFFAGFQNFSRTLPPKVFF
jgi:hypothetical protein